jgi:hypothetical protein
LNEKKTASPPGLTGSPWSMDEPTTNFEREYSTTRNSHVLWDEKIHVMKEVK